MIHLDKTLQSVVDLCGEVSEFIKYNFGKVRANQIETKAQNSLVSFVDKEAESMLVNGLTCIIPNATFITEEEMIDQSVSEYTWVIDPLDGTTNFLYQIPHFSISIGLQKNGKLVLGVVVDIMKDHFYTAYVDNGCFLNQDKIHVNPSQKLNEALIATGFPYASMYDKQPYFKMLEHIMTNCRGIRRFGSAALDLAYVATGQFNAFYETSLNPWDIAGGIVLCREAGGVCNTFFDDEINIQSGKSIIAGNQFIVDYLQSYTNKFFDKNHIS